ncbi:hypothetical protein B0H13DRAFT_2320679 [Mycena leptocephala]|nr:hypothetical protein B0H13DRAFT_2320679 [Mycena leptocephala]
MTWSSALADPSRSSRTFTCFHTLLVIGCHIREAEFNHTRHHLILRTIPRTAVDWYFQLDTCLFGTVSMPSHWCLRLAFRPGLYVKRLAPGLSNLG